MGLIVLGVVIAAIAVGIVVFRIFSSRSDRRRQEENARR